MRGRGASEMEIRARYRELHAQLTGETHLESCFRDQVPHPRETQHSLVEVVPVLTAEGMMVATSINRFTPVISLDALFTQERVLRAFFSSLRGKTADPWYEGWPSRKNSTQSK